MQNEIWDKKFVVKSVSEVQKIAVKSVSKTQKIVVKNVNKTQKIVVKNVNTAKSSLYILAGRDIIYVYGRGKG